MVHPIEESGTFINIEGRCQNTVNPFSGLRKGLSVISGLVPLIIMAVSIKKALVLNNKHISGKGESLFLAPSIGSVSGLSKNKLQTQVGLFNFSKSYCENKSTVYPRALEDFWFSNPIARRSKTLAKASSTFGKFFPFLFQ